MERLTFFCLAGTAYLSRSYQLIISSGNYCPAGCDPARGSGNRRDGRNIRGTASTRWMRPKQVAKSFRAVLFFFSRAGERAGYFITKYSFAALPRFYVIMSSARESLFGVNCRQRHCTGWGMYIIRTQIVLRLTLRHYVIRK